MNKFKKRIFFLGSLVLFVLVLVTVPILAKKNKLSNHFFMDSLKFDTLDVNNDEKLNKDEVSAPALEKFQVIDANNDQSISKDELLNYQKDNLIQKRLKRLESKSHKVFKRLDKNKDDKISQEEMLVRVEKMFSRLDKNENGFLDKEETKKLKKKWDRRKHKYNHDEDHHHDREYHHNRYDCDEDDHDEDHHHDREYHHSRYDCDEDDHDGDHHHHHDRD